MKSLTDPIRLSTSYLGFGMSFLVILKKCLIGMLIQSSTELSASTCQDPQDVHSLILEERQDPVIEGISRCGRDLGRIEPGNTNRGYKYPSLTVDISFPRL